MYEGMPDKAIWASDTIALMMLSLIGWHDTMKSLFKIEKKLDAYQNKNR